MTDYLYQDGQHYDWLFSSLSQDLPFWIDQAKKYGDPILELACGTGRVTIPLAQQGFRVTGIDHSEAMLNEAKRKSAAQGVAVDWKSGDMRDFDLGKTFALIILPSNTLCHLLTLADFEACLASVKNHLAGNGKFIIDVFVPRMDLLVDQPGERFPFGEYDDPAGREKVVVTHSYVYEPDTQIKRIKTYHSFPGQAEIEGELNMRMYFPQELAALLKYNGLLMETRFGDYDSSAVTAESQKQLIVCSVR